MTLPSLRRYPGAAWTGFALTFAGLLVYTLSQPAKPFAFDAALYWFLADAFEKSGHFSLLDFDSPLRGYALPLWDHVLKEAARRLGWNDSSAAKLFNVLVFSWLGAVLVPALAHIAFPKRRWGVVRRLALGVLLLVFWGGYLAFPLSDFPAIAAAVLALIAVARAPGAGWMALAGVSSALAINMRPSYVLLGPIVLGLALWSWIEARGSARGHRRWAVGGALLALGFVAISLPQSLATHRHFGSYSFLPGSAQNLSAFQFTEGTRLQRYETFVGPGKPNPSMNYVDEAGVRILAGRPNGTIRGSGDYLEVVLAHPVTMAGLWVRHLVNGLDQRYSTPYVESLAPRSRNAVRLLGFVLVFLALLRVAWPAARHALGPARWRYVAALPACCLTSIPSAMETRFMLPVYVTSWLLVLAGPWPNPLAAGGRRLRTPALIAIAFVAFVGVTWAIASRTTDTLQFGGS